MYLQLQVLLIHLNEYLNIFKVNPRHGHWDEDTVSGRCILRCDGGYEPSGCHIIRYSHREGNWNHDVPTCQKGKDMSMFANASDPHPQSKKKGKEKEIKTIEIATLPNQYIRFYTSTKENVASTCVHNTNSARLRG